MPKKISEIIKIEKKEVDHSDDYSPDSYTFREGSVFGYNQCREKYGNKSIGLDEGKIEKIFDEKIESLYLEREDFDLNKDEFNALFLIKKTLIEALKQAENELIVEVKNKYCSCEAKLGHSAGTLQNGKDLIICNDCGLEMEV